MPKFVDLDYNMGRIVGLYLAEGSIKYNRLGSSQGRKVSKRVSGVCFSVYEKEVARTIAWLSPFAKFYTSAKIQRSPNSKTCNVVAYGRSFGQFFLDFCGIKQEKHFPKKWEDYSPEFVRGVVHGYLSGDGHFSDRLNDRRIRLSTICPQLAFSLRDACGALGYGWPTISFQEAQVRCGRNEKAQWIVGICGSGSVDLAKELDKPYLPYKQSGHKALGYNGSAYLSDGYAWVPITTKEFIGPQEVLDFEIDHRDHSYCTIHGASHNSEVAWWEKGSDAAIALFQAVANEPNTSIVLETTANGEDLLFKPLWDGAEGNVRLTFYDDPSGPLGFRIEFEILNENDWNGYFPLFISAIDDEDCRTPLDAEEAPRIIQTLDEMELSLREQFNAPLEFIKWRRRALRFQCQGDLRILSQEYPCTSLEAFIASGSPRFDVNILNTMPIEDGVIGFLMRSNKWDREVSFREDKFEKMTVFKAPKHGHRYVIAIDTAEGLLPEGAKDPDESVAQVLDIDSGPRAEQVAIIAGQLSEEEMVERVALAGEYYNMAFLVPEWAGGHGEHLTIQLSKIYPQDRIYHRLDAMGESSGSGGMGLRVTLGNRNRLIADLSEAISGRDIILHDRETVKQCKHFVWNRRGRIEAATGHHDDRVFALIGGVHGWKHFPMSLDPSDGSLAGYEKDKRFPSEEVAMAANWPDDGGY